MVKLPDFGTKFHKLKYKLKNCLNLPYFCHFLPYFFCPVNCLATICDSKYQPITSLNALLDAKGVNESVRAKGNMERKNILISLAPACVTFASPKKGKNKDIKEI